MRTSLAKVGLATDSAANRTFGIGLFCGAIFFFTCLDTSAKIASQTLPTLQIVWFRFIGHLVLGIVAYGVMSGGRVPHVRVPWLQMVRSACLLGATACNFTALRYLQLAETTSIMFTVPLMVVSLAVPFLGEHVGARRWTAIIVGFLGVLIIIRPGVGIVHWAVILSLCAAFFTAAYQITTRRVAAADHSSVTQAITPIAGAFVLLPVMPWIWETPATIGGWTPLLATAVFGGVGHYIFIVAHRYTAAAILAPFIYIQIIFMTTSGYIFFHDVPDVWVFVGAAVIVGSGLYVWYREQA